MRIPDDYANQKGYKKKNARFHRSPPLFIIECHRIHEKRILPAILADDIIIALAPSVGIECMTASFPPASYPNKRRSVHTRMNVTVFIER